jgi:hypothetical protein
MSVMRASIDLVDNHNGVSKEGIDVRGTVDLT